MTAPTLGDLNRAVQALQKRLEMAQNNGAAQTARKIKTRLETAANLGKQGYALQAYEMLIKQI